MSEPVPPSRGKIPSRLIASVRRLPWKDAVIGVLALLFVSISGYAFRAPLAKALARLRAGSGRETVSVFNVVVDRDSREYFDVLFDKPWGRGGSGRCSIGLRRRPSRLSADLGSGRPPTLCGSSRAVACPSPASTR
jgi:hypothetical protein